MAKKSMIARNEHRSAVVARYAERRRELRRASVNPHLGPGQRATAMAALHALPRDASPTRVRERGSSDGRPRGNLRRFGLSRVQFRQAAHRNELPGVTKASW